MFECFYGLMTGWMKCHLNTNPYRPLVIVQKRHKWLHV